jgi:hypothetical protein
MRVSFGEAKQDTAGHWVVAVQRIHDDGSVEEGVHVFPADVLEWRAAEYDIDPSDVDTLLDIVLAEPYLTDGHWQAGSQLHDADTVEQARADHLARCAKAKLACRMSTRGKAAEPLRAVREQHAMHPEALEIKRELVRHAREQHRQARQHEAAAVRQGGEDQERLAELRQALHQLRAGQPPSRST